MIKRIQIENYKSIRKLDLELGRLNVFIGENGCGKTNILEAIALGSAAAHDKLSNEFLVPRGIRMTVPEFMRSAFDAPGTGEVALVFHTSVQQRIACRVVPADTGEDTTRNWVLVDEVDLDAMQGEFADAGPVDFRDARVVERVLQWLNEHQQARVGAVPEFLVFAPENTVLRNFRDEGQILPLGVKGEGLLAHLQTLASQPNAPVIAEINEHLMLLDWFESLRVPDRDQAGRALRIRDRFLPEGVVFDQRSANEGFLFLLFYFTLFASPQTPRFFAIDNVDASLNPKMCAALMASMVKLAKAHDKQAIVTTHNPSLLDGLDLTDGEQRLFVVSRRSDGSTRINRVDAPKPLDGDAPVRLSDAFVRGYIGGLPDNF